MTKTITFNYEEGHDIIDVFEPLARVIVKFFPDGYRIVKIEYSVIIKGVEVDITEAVNAVIDKPCNAKLKSYLIKEAKWEIDNNEDMHNEALAEMGLEHYEINSDDFNY